MYVVAFFKIMQQQTIGEVANSVALLWADNFCLQQSKNYLNRTVFVKVMLKWKSVQFFLTHSVHLFYQPNLVVLEISCWMYLLFNRTGTISPGDYLLAIGDVWLDNHSLEEAARVLTAADKVVKLRIQKNECYAGNISVPLIRSRLWCFINLFTYLLTYSHCDCSVCRSFSRLMIRK